MNRKQLNCCQSLPVDSSFRDFVIRCLVNSSSLTKLFEFSQDLKNPGNWLDSS